jgi:hypothetical protein
MTRHALPFFPFVLVIVGGVWASAARAQEGFSGSWKVASSSAEAAEGRASIGPATQELPYLMGSRGGERFEERTTPLPKVRISVEAEGRRGSVRATPQEGNLDAGSLSRHLRAVVIRLAVLAPRLG